MSRLAIGDAGNELGKEKVMDEIVKNPKIVTTKITLPL
jgi:hypothetical protein